MDLRVRTATVGGVFVVALDGTADLGAAPLVHQALRGATSSQRGIVAIDLDGVAVLDDAVLGLLVGAAERVRASGGELIVVCTAERLLARFHATRLDQILTIRPSVAAGAAEHTGSWTPSGSSATS
jgi:anti-anti-sigma factor